MPKLMRCSDAVLTTVDSCKVGGETLFPTLEKKFPKFYLIPVGLIQRQSC